jgi:TetR/AcrR family transcriptional regulator
MPTRPRRRPASAAPRRRRALRRPPRRAGPRDVRDSRERLFNAAAAEFAARGFAGASVDRIAALAGVNKAMIYYHFSSKAALYRAILGDMFHAVAARARAVATSDAAPEDKLRRFVEAIADEAEARPHFPPIWFREIAEGGAHLGAATLADITAVVQALMAILQQGARARRFRQVNPLLVHGGIVGPLLMFFASAPLRRRLARGGLAGASAIGRDDVVSYVQRVALGMLKGAM